MKEGGTEGGRQPLARVGVCARASARLRAREGAREMVCVFCVLCVCVCICVCVIKLLLASRAPELHLARPDLFDHLSRLI